MGTAPIPWVVTCFTAHSKPIQPTAAITHSHQTQETTIKDHLCLLHAACFSSVTSTLPDATNKNVFITWPGLTTINEQNHLPKSPFMVKVTLTNNDTYAINKRQDNQHYHTTHHTHMHPQCFTALYDLIETTDNMHHMVGTTWVAFTFSPVMATSTSSSSMISIAMASWWNL